MNVDFDKSPNAADIMHNFTMLVKKAKEINVTFDSSLESRCYQCENRTTWQVGDFSCARFAAIELFAASGSDEVLKQYFVRTQLNL